MPMPMHAVEVALIYLCRIGVQYQYIFTGHINTLEKLECREIHNIAREQYG